MRLWLPKALWHDFLGLALVQEDPRVCYALWSIFAKSEADSQDQLAKAEEPLKEQTMLKEEVTPGTSILEVDVKEPEKNSK